MNSKRLKTSLEQWRNSLVNLSSRNKLLNYKKTRASTIEFSDLDAAEIYNRILSRSRTYVLGTKAELPRSEQEPESVELEDLVNSEIHEFDYSQFPDSLFTSMTQRDVDKALKSLSEANRREFLDKGISPLYLALGSLSWVDDAEDHRTSPLIMVPVSLSSSGQKEPLHLSRSDDDIAVNPALALKLFEFGIVLPTSEEVIDAIYSGGIEAAFELFRGLNLKENWNINDFATLAVFAFQKEAMYRDLVDNQKQVLGNPVVQALGGGTKPGESSFYFEPIDQAVIDELAPPESTPLVLDADSSQRAAVAAAVAGQSFVLDGPPGTGKSQTIANIIGALIDQGKSVLFVSEKIVALEVVKDRLKDRGLEPFLFELHSHKATRKEVAKLLGEALKNKPKPRKSLPSVELRNAEDMRKQLNDYAEAMNESREPLEVSVHEVLGLLERLDVHRAYPTPDFDVSQLSPTDVEAVRDAAQRIGRYWGLHLAGENALWFGLINREELAFRVESAISALATYESIYAPVKSVAAELQLTGTFHGGILYEILQHWSVGSEFREEKWLTLNNLDSIKESVRRLGSLNDDLNGLEVECARCLGPQWKQLMPMTAPMQKSDYAALGSLVNNWELIPVRTLVDYSSELSELIAEFEVVLPELITLANRWGLSQPKVVGDLKEMHTALNVLGTRTAPPVGWIAQSRNRKKAKEAFEILKPLVDELREAEESARMFTRSVIELDLNQISDFFEVNNGLFASFSKPYRVQRQLLSSCSKASNWKETLQALPLAIKWKNSLTRLDSAEAIHARSIAPLYASTETDWVSIVEALKVSKRILSAFEVVDTEKFDAALESKSAKRDLRTQTAGLDKLLNALNSWASFKDTSALSALQPMPLEVVVSQLTGVADDLKHVSDALSPVIESMPDVTKIASALDGLTKVWNLSLLFNSAESTLKAESKALHFDVTLEQMRTEGFFDVLAQKVVWTEELLRLANLEEGEEKHQKPLSAKQVAALKSAEMPDSFQDAYVSWQNRWLNLKSSFSPELEGRLDGQVGEFAQAAAYLKSLNNSLPEVDHWVDLAKSIETLEDFGLRASLDAAVDQGLGSELAPKFILMSLLSSWTSFVIENDNRLHDDPTYDRSHFVEIYRNLDVQLKEHAVNEIVNNGITRRPRSGLGEAALIERESEKKSRHIPVRELIDRSRNAIQGLHPCFMMSPLAVSQYLPSDIEFDVVIFDEASQVTPGDAINCAYRGKALITAGDQKQLPPMSFFATSGLEDANLEEDAAGDYDSVLDLMKASGCFSSMTLNWHYRSRHEHLIAYSNFAFYNSRLITFPGAIAESDDLGVKFFKVDGIYRRSGGSDNPIEAQEVARRVIHHFDTRHGQSLGVVAFSTSQRDAIDNAVTLARRERPDLEKYFEGDRQDGFFVNSLEAVQGDERDVIIFSIGYGPDELGKIYKNFGPLNRAGGERRLNVAITRARKLVEIVSSMTASELGDVNNEGARHLRKYLDFAERGPAALQMELGDSGLGTDSPFEDSVISAIRSWGYEVQPQVGVAGYRIDIGVKHPNYPGTFILGVECDGAMYHSSHAARDRDRLRHEILEGLGWKIYHIWGTSWYRHRGRELERLKAVLTAQAKLQVSGRLVIEKTKNLSPPIEITYEENDGVDMESWTTEYEIAAPSKLKSNIDFSDLGSADYLVPFVIDVVRTEGPIHKDLLVKRLRESSSLAKVGTRVRSTIERAISRSKVKTQGEFLWPSVSRDVHVRRANPEEIREISMVCSEELSAAIEAAVIHAIGISRTDLIKLLGSVYGWKRTGSQIETRLLEEIDNLIALKVLVEAGGGLKVA